MVLRRVVVLVRLRRRCRLLHMMLRLLLTGDGGVWSSWRGSMPVVRDGVQLRALRVHIRLLVSLLLVLRLLR